MRTTFFIMLIISLAACASFNEERKEVAALQERVDQVEVRFQNLNRDSLAMSEADINLRLGQVAEFYAQQGGGMDLVIANKLSYFRSAGKLFKKLDPNMQRIRKEIETTRKQLSDLDTDLKNKAFDASKAAEYLTQETEAVEDLWSNISRLDTLRMRAESMYLENLPTVDSLIATFTSGN